jgi:predicted lipoprotein with Yx(FWY)xxD motif
MKPLRFAVLATVFALCAGTAAADAPVKKAEGILVTNSGMTVYTFDKDAANSVKSACSGQCLELWPAVPAGNTPLKAPYSAITREDGSKQLAYKGKPLHTYAPDKNPGERRGDKFKNVWHVVPG